MPGIEGIAWREIHALSPDARNLGLRTAGNQNGLVLFDYPDDPRALLRLRTAEDVFFLAGWTKGIPADRTGLNAITQMVQTAKYFDVGLGVHRLLRGTAKRRATFRVIARMEGGPHAYRRVDVQKAVEKGVLARYNYKWHVVQDDATLEVWVTLLGAEAICGLRLSDRSMRHRGYKAEHLPASLRPSVAAAMVLLSNPQPGDVFLDPMCGAGTILGERAAAAPYQALLGGDINRASVQACRANVRPRRVPADIREWDATHLPLPDAGVDKVVCNLPFGKQVGTHAENVELYPRYFAEMARVVRPGGRLVILTGEQALTERILSSSEAFRKREQFDVRVLGMAARILVIDRE
ncbi:MAG: methyltransferase domain-containing protein [Thiobacillaceae bacterium]